MRTSGAASETNMTIVECFNRETNTCTMISGCTLKHFLADANTAFLHSLNQHTLEHFPTGMNRLGFPKRRESDSSWMLAREVSMHDQGAFR